MADILKVYKGTDKDMKCRGMQYEIGKTEKSDDAIRCGDKGFHSCEAPFDVWNIFGKSYEYREKYNAYKKQRMEKEARKKRSSDIQGQLELQAIADLEGIQ